MAVEILKSLVLPIVCGLVPVITALIAAAAQRYENLKAMRLDAYQKYESAIAEWAKSKNDETLAGVYDASNVVRLVGSKKTAQAVSIVTNHIRENPAGIIKSLEEFHRDRLTLLAAMRNDLQATLCKRPK